MTVATALPPVHSPLPADNDALRLLNLQPKLKKRKRGAAKGNYASLPNGAGAQNDVRGELVSRTFASKPVYECLSYTWGDEPADKHITINGQQFLVRKNLFNALRHLRQKTPRALWIDAICINQEDVEERSKQVSLMAFIYRRAARTVVWLGLSPKPYTSTDGKVMQIQEEANAKSIVNNPYWSHLWTVQETVLARDIQFVHRNLEFNWQDLSQVLGHSPLWDTLEERVRSLVDHRDRYLTDVFRLEALLDRFRNFQCPDKRDKIYGLLGLSHDCSNDEIEADYRMSIFELYRNLVDFHQDSEPLPICRTSKSYIRPELDRTVRLMKFSSLIQSLLEGSVEEDARTIDFNFQPERYYFARGAFACKILHLGPTYSQTVGWYKPNRAWDKTIEKVYASSKREVKEELRGDNFAYSRDILDWDEAKVATIRNIDSKTSFGFLYAVWGEEEYVPPDESDGPGARDTGQEGADSPRPVEEPRRFLGTNSRIGFAPPNARPGDEVYNFYDCDVAVVVRRVGGTLGNRWKIIGKADLCCREMEEGKKQKIIPGALDRVLGSADPVPVQEDLMINLKMDIEVLQKLTC